MKRDYQYTSEYKAQRRKRYHAKGSKSKSYYLKRKFGISIDDYDTILDRQGGCALCINHIPDKTAFCVDHSHTTGEVRGILCRRHNLGIGYFNDNIEELKKAIKYLT